MGRPRSRPRPRQRQRCGHPIPNVRGSVLTLALLLAACGENLTHPDGPPAYAGPDAAPLACVPDLDGVIAADEMQAAVGVPVTFLVSAPGVERPVDLAGAVDGSGHRVWDWSAPAGDDLALEVAARPLAGNWYASSFPGGQFVLSVDAAATLDAVYSHDGAAVRMHGMVSPEAEPAEGVTLLVYQQPVELYRFPLAPGASWVAVGEVQNGTYRGLPYAGRDTYEVEVAAAGQLHLPDLTFTQAHQVRTRVTVEPAVGVSTSRRQVSFVFECFGEVARAVSRPGEPLADFTIAAEVRRLGM